MAELPEQGGQLHYAALVAHQLKSPLSSASTHLLTLLNGYAGPLTPKQQEMVETANERCKEALDAAERMLVIAKTMQDPSEAKGRSEVVRMAHQTHVRFGRRAALQGIELRVVIDTGHVVVPMAEPVLFECLNSVVSNALKYTPENGTVEVRVAQSVSWEKVAVTVADTGIGVPEAERERVFEPFYRSNAARRSARAGVGLGLTFVKTVTEAVGGSVRLEMSDLGGAAVVLELPVLEQTERDGDVAEANRKKVLIIGGVAAGPKVASKVIRLDPDADVTIVEKGEFMSYAGCGLPYYVSGVVKEQKELMSTPVGVVRDPVFFQKVKNIHVLNRTEALEIDREGKRVRVLDHREDAESWLDYDVLMLATGATPFKPPIPGVDLRNVYSLHGVDDAEGIKALLSENKAKDVVVVGGGLIGVETTEALVQSGSRVTIVEMLSQILPMLDWEMAKLVEQHLESHGVKVLTDCRVQSIKGDGAVSAVVTEKGELPADLVIMSVGVRPNVGLAQAAGLEIGSTGAIKVDDHLRTSDPDIYAAGDCVETKDLLTGRPTFVPLGSTANKQGRVAAMNICGRDDVFPGVLGTTVCKVFDYCVARVGLSEDAARKAGFDVLTVLAPAPDRAHYMPTAKPLLLKLIVDKASRKLLGVQATGPGAGDKRIDVAAMALHAGMTVDEFANVDLSYAPPYSPAMDNLHTAANVARNKLDGVMEGITPMEVHQKLVDGEEFFFLDARSPGEVQQVRLPKATNIPLGALRSRIEEVPRDKEVVTFCKISLRGYEAALILKAVGYENVKVMDGGVVMWPYEKLT